MEMAIFLLIGLTGGLFSGLLGIGGATVLIPALIYFSKMSLRQAQGTTLAAFLPPVALLAVINFYKSGFVNVRGAIWLALGLLVGGYFGSLVNLSASEDMVRKIFGVFLLIIALKFLIR